MPPPRQTGAALVMALAAVALLALVAANTVSVSARLQRRDAEQDLLRVGLTLETALYSYAGIAAGQPLPPGRGPKTLEDLLRDPRTPGVRRHLRQIPLDPLTGEARWGLQRDTLGSIVGIHSLAAGVPLKQDDFDALHRQFKDATSYRAWVFGSPR